MNCYLTLLIWIAVILILIRLYVRLTTGWCKSSVCLAGKTAIVTGANTGIGYETAADFAKRGAKVILACRNTKKAQDAMIRMKEETDNPNIFIKKLDLASFKSIRDFVADVRKSERRLDILVNNAGAFSLGKKMSEDGLLLLAQTNYFGPFLLTNLILDLLKKTPNSRIVNVSSISARFTAWGFSVNKLNDFPSDYPPWIDEFVAYSRTKLCNILFTMELAKRLKGTTVTTYSVHPGIMKTELLRSQPFIPRLVMELTMKLYKSVDEGAQTIIYCSVAQNIEHLSGEHFHDCQLYGPYESASDEELPKKLWEKTEKILNLDKERQTIKY